MKQRAIESPEAKIARRNYLVFSIVSAVVLIIVVLVTTLFLTG